MANVDARIGLTPIRHRNGANYNGAVNPYYLPVGYDVAMFVGDPVIKTGTANTTIVDAPSTGQFQVGTLAEINKATAGDGNRITGVIVGFAPNPDNLTLKHNPNKTERVALVCDDPDVIFEIQADGAIPATSIGLNANLIFTHSGEAATGISGVELDTTSDVPDTDATNQLLIMRASNRVGNDTTLTHANVEVMINQHTENQGTVGTVGI